MFLSWVEKLAMAFLRRIYSRRTKNDNPSSSSSSSSSSPIRKEEKRDSLLWSRDLEKHSLGEYSFAVVQANEVIEDHSQVETCKDATFVGVYDGHGGPDASRFVSDQLFSNLMRLVKENGNISEEILRSAFLATEDGFLALVRRTFMWKPLIAAIGSCCLVGIIWRGKLLVANLGDSRAVLDSLGKSKKIVAEQLTMDHNACREEVRQELKSLHPDDSNIVVLKQGVWRIKGVIQVSKSIGDAYLKQTEFAFDPSFPRFHLSEPIRRPVLTSEPSLCCRSLNPNDKFVIFASDGLWEHVPNQEAVEIVYNNPRKGIAKRLVKAAMDIAARKINKKYKDLKKIEKGDRRFIHDDITVVVIFTDSEVAENDVSMPGLSVKGFVDTAGPSKFDTLQGLEDSIWNLLG